MSDTALASAAVTMPDDLKDAGWRLHHILDGDKWRAKNREKGLSSSAVDTPEEAIAAARELEAGKTIALSPSGDVSFKQTRAPELKNIGWGVIRIDGGTQPREELDEETVAAYAEAKLAGDKFPPLTVFFDGKYHWLADGFHRYWAHRKHETQLGPGIDVEIHQGTQRDAILYSLGANHNHGLPRSPEDKRQAVQKMLTDPEWSQMSDGAIAIAAKVSQPFVSKLRRNLPLIDGPETTQNVLSDDDKVVISPPARKGRDGRTVNTSKIGKVARTPAQKDIAFSPPSNAEGKTRNLIGEEPEGWRDLQLVLHITVKPGKSDKRGIFINGRAGEGKPLFRSDFTALDLLPMPPALAGVVADLQKAYAKSGAKVAAAVKGAKAKPAKKQTKPKARKK